MLYSGYVFASAVETGGYDATAGQNKQYSPSAWMDVKPVDPSTWAWDTQPYEKRLLDENDKTVNLHDSTAVLHPYTVTSGGCCDTPDEVIMIGGHDHQGPPPGGSEDATNLVWKITDPHLETPWVHWSVNQATATGMNYPRLWANAVLMPDLSVIVFGGSRNDFNPYDLTSEVEADPVFEPERLDFLDPLPEPCWTILEPQVSPRLYHSVATLLPDGRVLSAGGYKQHHESTNWPHSDAEVFTPPYLRQAIARPVITSAPTTMTYGGTGVTLGVQVADSANSSTFIEFATLIRCGAVTHHFDTDQRAIRLDIDIRSGNNVTLVPLPTQAQGGDFLAPPGWYMLFLVRYEAGSPKVRVPSVARFIQVT